MGCKPSAWFCEQREQCVECEWREQQLEQQQQLQYRQQLRGPPSFL